MQTPEKPSQVAPRVSHEEAAEILDVPLRLSDFSEGCRGVNFATTKSFLALFTSERHSAKRVNGWHLASSSSSSSSCPSVFIKYSYAEARKTLELKLLGPLSSNMRSEVI